MTTKKTLTSDQQKQQRYLTLHAMSGSSTFSFLSYKETAVCSVLKLYIRFVRNNTTTNKRIQKPGRKHNAPTISSGINHGLTGGIPKLTIRHTKDTNEKPTETRNRRDVGYLDSTTNKRVSARSARSSCETKKRKKPGGHS